MVRELIDCKGERHLYEQLLEYLTEHNYAKSTKTQLERKALEGQPDHSADCRKQNQERHFQDAHGLSLLRRETDCENHPRWLPADVL